jgi:hypothetical protein
LGEKKRQLAGNVHSAMAIDPSVHVSLVCSDTFVVFRSRKSTKQKQKNFSTKTSIFLFFFSKIPAFVQSSGTLRESASQSVQKVLLTD